MKFANLALFLAVLVTEARKHHIRQSMLQASVVVEKEEESKNKQRTDAISAVFYINLDKSKERRNHMEHALSGSSGRVERISAISGDRINEMPLAKKYVEKQGLHGLLQYGSLLQGEMAAKVQSIIGCWLSHVTLWERLLTELRPQENALILEDDVALPPTWETDVMEAVKTAPTGWKVLKVCGWGRDRAADVVDENWAVVRWPAFEHGLSMHTGSCGYVVSGSTVRPLLNHVLSQPIKDLDVAMMLPSKAEISAVSLVQKVKTADYMIYEQRPGRRAIGLNELLASISTIPGHPGYGYNHLDYGYNRYGPHGSGGSHGYNRSGYDYGYGFDFHGYYPDYGYGSHGYNRSGYDYGYVPDFQGIYYPDYGYGSHGYNRSGYDYGYGPDFKDYGYGSHGYNRSGYDYGYGPHGSGGSHDYNRSGYDYGYGFDFHGHYPDHGYGSHGYNRSGYDYGYGPDFQGIYYPDYGYGSHGFNRSGYDYGYGPDFQGIYYPDYGYGSHGYNRSGYDYGYGPDFQGIYYPDYGYGSHGHNRSGYDYGYGYEFHSYYPDYGDVYDAGWTYRGYNRPGNYDTGYGDDHGYDHGYGYGYNRFGVNRFGQHYNRHDTGQGYGYGYNRFG